MISATKRYVSCSKMPFQIVDTNLNQIYSGTVGVKIIQSLKKNLYFNLFGAETNYLIYYMNGFLNLTPIFSVNLHLSE